MEERPADALKKEVVLLEDGRYLIYYTFESKDNTSTEESLTISPRKGEEHV